MDTAMPSAKRMKVSLENHSFLPLFAENAWEKKHIKNLGEWLILKGADINASNWYLLWRYNNYRKEIIGTSEEDTFKSRVASDLRDIIPVLFNCNDDINYTDADGRTILHVYLASDKKYCSLHKSVNEPKDLKVVKSLLNKGASINAVDKYGKTPLHIATTNKNFVLVEPILNFVDSYLDVCDKEGDTVLHKVFQRNFFDDNVCTGIVRALLSKGADPNKRNKNGMTPLQYSVIHCNVNLLQIFKEHGAVFNVLIADNDYNLLHLVYKGGVYINKEKRIETINFLVEQGCDVNFKNKNGYSIIHLVAKRYLPLKTYVEYIKLRPSVNNRMKMYEQTPRQLVSIDHKKLTILTTELKSITSTMTNAGADWDARDCEGMTPLHHVLTADFSEAVACILSFGASINDRKVRELLKKCSVNSRNAIIKRAVELKTINLSIDKVYKSPINKRKDLKNYQAICLKEVDIMRTRMISNSDEVSLGVSLYEFIHLNWKRQLDLLRYIPRDLDNDFPIYNGTILNACNEAKRRIKLLVSAKMAWYESTKINFPDICVECILSFLNNCSLNTLIHVSETMT